HDRVPGEHHLREDRRGEGLVGAGIEGPGHRIHLLTPGPEGAAIGVRASAEGAVEGVRVGVGEARSDEAFENVVARLEVYALLDLADDTVLHADPDPLAHALGKDGPRGPVRLHRWSPVVRSARTSAS